MNIPEISVVMLTCHRPHLIGRAIESVRMQRFPGGWELIVVHDGGDVPTQAVMLEWSGRDERIRYFHRETPGNIADATNFGIAQARGRYIAILDDDDYWAAPEKLEMQARFLDANPEYVACGGGAIVVDQNGRETLRYLKPEHDGSIRGGALLANPIVHSTVVFRASTARALGGYDAGLEGFQDWDFVLRLGMAGKLYNFPAYLTCYSMWSGAGSVQNHAKDARCALTIVWRHQRVYSHGGAALGLALCSYLYAHLPAFITRPSYAWLARMKKKRFSGSPVAVR